MNMMLIILFLVMMVVFVGVFVGLISLQVHISKKNKKGKFAIPIIMFLLPFIAVILIIASFMVVKDSGTTEVESSVSTEMVKGNGEVIMEKEVVTEESDMISYMGASVIAIAYVLCIIGFPTAITTLVIELVYRAKRKNIPDEDVIDIQNL